MKQPFRALSWGCGVQSTTLGEMSVSGEIDPLNVILTADPGWERQATYDIRNWYTHRWRSMGQHVEIINTGNIKIQGAQEHIHIPFWTSNGGPLNRQCTREFKIRPIRRRTRELLGFHPSKPPAPPPGTVEQWLGISLDEYTRMKHSDVQYITNRWPLIELRMTRQDCIDWLKDRNLPVPIKSACIGCPYRLASEWLEMLQRNPDEFNAAVEFDRANRHNPLADRGGSTADELYTFKGCQPLELGAEMLKAAAEKEQKRPVQLPLLCESGYCHT